MTLALVLLLSAPSSAAPVRALPAPARVPAAARLAPPVLAAALPAPPAAAASDAALAAPQERPILAPLMLPPGAEDAPRGPEAEAESRLRQGLARLGTLGLRAATMAAYLWPFSEASRLLSHGEPLAGLTPRAAAREAARAEGPVVIGRLAWELHDPWSARGAERSYLRLIERLAERRVDAAVSIDADSLGLELRGAGAAERERRAGDAAIRIARAARERGLPVEFDMGSAKELEGIARVAARTARELRMPVRLAIAARYGRSRTLLREWAALSGELGMPLGVRLVKGSFVEADQPDAENLRRPLLARYKSLITLAFEQGARLDVVVATQNREIWEHARAESGRLGKPFRVDMIRGVAPELREQIRKSGKLGREYLSYGLDAPSMGLSELYENWKQRRRIPAPAGEID